MLLLKLSYSWVQKVLDGYEANLLLWPMLKGLYLPCSSMEFQVKGLIWKVVAWSLNSQHFMTLSRTVTENWVDKEDTSTAFLFTAARGSLSKSGFDASSLWTQFSVTAQLSIMKYRQFKDQANTFQMSPITWNSIEEHGRYRPSNIGHRSKFAS